MKRECGNCTLCCKLLGVKELDKPTNVWCKHCAIGKGCKIYPDRPLSCQWFECGWLLSDLPIEYRPDHLHIVVTGEAEKLDAVILHVDPNYPNAINTLYAQSLLRLFEKENKSIILVIGNKRKLISGSMKDVAALEEILKKMERNEK